MLEGSTGSRKATKGQLWLHDAELEGGDRMTHGWSGITSESSEDQFISIDVLSSTLLAGSKLSLHPERR